MNVGKLTAKYDAVHESASGTKLRSRQCTI